MREKVVIDDKMCRKVQLMLAGGASQAEVAEIIGVSSATVSRIRTAEFSVEQYRKNTDRRLEEQRQRMPKQKQLEIAPTQIMFNGEPVEQVPGQIEMDLIKAAEKPAEMSDQTKMMRFQASQVDKICVKLDRIIDLLSMTLRARTGA